MLSVAHILAYLFFISLTKSLNFIFKTNLLLIYSKRWDYLNLILEGSTDDKLLFLPTKRQVYSDFRRGIMYMYYK